MMSNYRVKTVNGNDGGHSYDNRYHQNGGSNVEGS